MAPIASKIRKDSSKSWTSTAIHIPSPPSPASRFADAEPASTNPSVTALIPKLVFKPPKPPFVPKRRSSSGAGFRSLNQTEPGGPHMPSVGMCGVQINAQSPVINNSRTQPARVSITSNPPYSVHGFRLAAHVIHQQILSQRVRRSEVRLAPAHLCHLLHKLHQPAIRSKHERVDQHTGALALRNFLQRLAHHHGVQSKGVLVNPAIGQRHRRRLAIGDHDDLLHVLALSLQDALRQL